MFNSINATKYPVEGCAVYGDPIWLDKGSWV